MAPTSPSDKITAPRLREMKEKGERIAMLTAYDATFSRLLDEAGIEILLVGDSAGMVIAGHTNTLPVTMEETLYHCRAVARGAHRAQVVGDMPFMSYQTSIEEGMRNAGRLIKEGAVEAIKLEGGADHAELVRRLVRVGIPVMGHIGLTPQSVHAMGGFKVQGRDTAGAERLLADARVLEEAGCYAIVLEGIPRQLARRITESVTIPTIGIGAGPDCDGQVLVVYDLLGMNDAFRPKFVKRYDQLGVRIRTSVQRYIDDVKDGLFPTEEHSFGNAPTRRNAATALYSSVRTAAVAGTEAPVAAEAAAGTAASPPSNVVQLPACGWPRSIEE